MTKTKQFILSYLKGKEFTSPTEIGSAYCQGLHSAWASPKCLSLTKEGYLERNDKGWYKLKHSDNSNYQTPRLKPLRTNRLKATSDSCERWAKQSADHVIGGAQWRLSYLLAITKVCSYRATSTACFAISIFLVLPIVFAFQTARCGTINTARLVSTGKCASKLRNGGLHRPTAAGAPFVRAICSLNKRRPCCETLNAIWLRLFNQARREEKMKKVQAILMYHWINPFTGQLVTKSNCNGTYGAGWGEWYQVTPPRTKRKRSKTEKRKRG